MTRTTNQSQFKNIHKDTKISLQQSNSRMEEKRKTIHDIGKRKIFLQEGVEHTSQKIKLWYNEFIERTTKN